MNTSHGGVPTPKDQEAPEFEKPKPAKAETVYVTRTGKEYRRAGCQYLRRSKQGLAEWAVSTLYDEITEEYLRLAVGSFQGPLLVAGYPNSQSYSCCSVFLFCGCRRSVGADKEDLASSTIGYSESVLGTGHS